MLGKISALKKMSGDDSCALTCFGGKGIVPYLNGEIETLSGIKILKPFPSAS